MTQKTDNREVGMKVWLCPPYGETPRQISVTKVTATGVTCDDGKRYNLKMFQTWGRLHGSQTTRSTYVPIITTICQQSCVDIIIERERRMVLMDKLDGLMAGRKSTTELEALIAFLESQQVPQGV